RAVTEIEEIPAGQGFERRLVARRALRLPVRSGRAADVGALVPVEAEPAEIVELARLRARHGPRPVEVLDAEYEGVPGGARRPPRAQGGGRRAEMEIAGGRGSEASARRSAPRREDVGGRVQRLHRRRHARIAGGLHQHLDQLFAADPEIQGAVEMALQLVDLAERGELGNGAQAPAAQVEVRASPEAAEYELRHQGEELGREALRGQLLPAGPRTPELACDLPSLRHEIGRVGHRRRLLTHRSWTVDAT